MTLRTSALLLVLTLPARAAAQAPDKDALASKAHAVLKANCHRCHGQDGANEGGFNYVLDRQQLVTRKKIVPGESDKSRLIRRILNVKDPMPPEEERVRPSKEDIALLKRWIEAGGA